MCSAVNREATQGRLLCVSLFKCCSADFTSGQGPRAGTGSTQRLRRRAVLKGQRAPPRPEARRRARPGDLPGNPTGKHGPLPTETHHAGCLSSSWGGLMGRSEVHEGHDTTEATRPLRDPPPSFKRTAGGWLRPAHVIVTFAPLTALSMNKKGPNFDQHSTDTFQQGSPRVQKRPPRPPVRWGLTDTRELPPGPARASPPELAPGAPAEQGPTPAEPGVLWE